MQADLEEELVNLDTHMARLRVVAPAIRQRDLTDKRICVLLTFEADETESRTSVRFRGPWERVFIGRYLVPARKSTPLPPLF